MRYGCALECANRPAGYNICTCLMNIKDCPKNKAAEKVAVEKKKKEEA